MGSPKWDDRLMHKLLQSTQWTLLMLGSQAYGQVAAPVEESIAPGNVHGIPDRGADDKTQDPFSGVADMNAGSQERDSSAAPVSTPDPFVGGDAPPAKRLQASRLTVLPVNVLYQGSYIPDVISDGGSDNTAHSLILDGTVNWTPSDSAALRGRVLFEGDVQRQHSSVTDGGEISGLAYYYEQHFVDQSQTLIVGRKYLGWSSGFQWRPADLIQNGFTTKSIDIADPNQYLGIDQIGYEINHPRFNVQAVISNKDYGFYDGPQSAVKVGLSGASGLSLVYSRNGDYESKYGLIIDRSLPWSSTLALEAVRVDIDRKLMYDSRHFGRTLESLTGTSRFENVYVSLTRFIDDKRRVDVQFLYDGNGFRDASAGAPKSTSQTQVPAAHQATIDGSIFADQYIGKYYSYLAYTGYIVGWKLQWKPSLLMNDGDHSYIGSISVGREFRGNTSLTLVLSSFHGAAGTEFGSISHGLGVNVSYVVNIL